MFSSLQPLTARSRSWSLSGSACSTTALNPTPSTAHTISTDSRINSFRSAPPGQRAAAQVGDGFLLPGAGTNLGVGAGEFGGAAFDAAFEAEPGVFQFAAGPGRGG